MSFEYVKNSEGEVIECKFTCDARNCGFSECNGKPYPNLPDGWGKFEIKTKLPTDELIEAGGDLCPGDLERLAQFFVKVDGWKGLASRAVVENPFPFPARPQVPDPRATINPAYKDVSLRKCAFCGGGGPFESNESVLEKSKGNYGWTNVCKWCDADILPGDRPMPVAEYLAGPTGKEKKTSKTK